MKLNAVFWKDVIWKKSLPLMEKTTFKHWKIGKSNCVFDLYICAKVNKDPSGWHIS